MSNQPQSRPWFRLSSVARAPQPQAPAPTPAVQPARPQTQAPAPIPRPAFMRPAFRPPRVTQPPPAQEPAPPPRTPAPTPSVPSAQPRPSPSVTFGAPSQPFRPPITTTLTPSVPAPAPPPVTTTLAPRAPESTPIAARSPPSPPPLATSMAPRTPAPPPVAAPPLTTTFASRTPESPVSQKSPLKSQTPPSLLSSPSSPPKVQAISPPKPSFPVHSIAPSMPSPTPSNRSFTARVPSPAESPRAVKPLPYFAPPPPFTLPPSQLNSDRDDGPKIPAETEKKTVHVQENVGKPKSFLQSYDSGSQKAHIGTTVKPKQRDFYNKFSDSEDGSIRVITIGGDNKGAVMELGYSPRRRGSGSGSSLNSPRTFRSDANVSEGKSSDSEGRSKLQGNVHNATTKPAVPMHAFMNSNVQGINSSIVFNSSCSHHDAGVHLSLTRKPLNKNHSKEKGQ